MKNLFYAFIDECDALIHSVSGLTVLVLGVVFYSLLYPLPYQHEGPQKLPVLIVDQDHSTTSRTLTRMIDSTEGARVTVVFNDIPQAMQALRDGEGEAVLVIPSDFEKNILRGNSSTIPLYCDAGYLLSYRMVFTGIKTSVEMMGAGVRIQRMQKMGVPEMAAKSMQLRGQMDVRIMYNPAGEYALSTIPPVFVLILQQTLLVGSAALAGHHLCRSLRRKNFRGNLDSPFHLLGRILFLTCLFLIHCIYYMWFLPMLYDLPRVTTNWDMLLFLLPFFLACASLGSIFAGLAIKPENVLFVVLPCSLPLLFLSGSVWPVEAMPQAMQFIGHFIPSRPAITGYMLMSDRGAAFAELRPLWGQLWGLALLYFGLAWGAMRVMNAKMTESTKLLRQVQALETEK